MSKQMTPIERVVLSLIPISDERRVNIKDIVAQTRLSTRRVKKIIDQLINNYGIVIVGGKKRTYWIFYSSNRPSATRRGIAAQSAGNQRV